VAVATHPVGRPPHLEPEYAHEPYVPQLSQRCHVAAPGLIRVEPHEATHHRVGGFGIQRGRRGGYYVGRDFRQKRVAVSEKV